MTLRIELVRDVGRLRAIAPAWDALVREWDTGLFASPRWFLTWWEHFAADVGPLVVREGADELSLPANDRRLHVLACWDGTDLAGVLPLVRARGRWRRCPARILAAPVNAHSVRAPLVVRGGDGGVLPAVVEALAATPGWDVLVLDGLAQRRGEAPRVAELGAQLGLSARVRDAWSHAYLAVTGTWDAFLAQRRATRSGHHLRRARQSERALERLGPVAIARYTGADIDDGMRHLMDVDAGSWKAGRGETLAAAPHAARFYTEVARRYAADGHAEVWILQLAGERIAGLLWLRDHARRRYTLKGSFKASMGRYSPGVALVDRLVREAHEAGDEGVDFLSDMPAFDRWASEHVEFGGVTAFHRHPYARVLARLDDVRRRRSLFRRPAPLATGAAS